MSINHGYIYALSNPAIPGLVKIGRTADLTRRIKHLNSATGVPHPFHLLGAVFVDDYVQAELTVQDLLWFCRESERREFFRCHHRMAVAALQCAAELLASPDAVWEISYPFRRDYEFKRIAAAIQADGAGPHGVGQ